MRHLRRGVAAITLLAFTACSGGGGSRVTPHVNPGPSAAPGQTVQSGTIVLPPGSTLSLSSLTVTTSAGKTASTSSGSFAVPMYRGDRQFTLVRDSAGHPVLAGFLGATAQTIDAASTAKLLAFFASGFYMLPAPYRSQSVDAITTAPGFAAVQTAITTGLQSNNPDLTSNTALATALKNLVQSLFSSSASGRLKALVHEAASRAPKGVIIDPTGAQSGITAITDFPSGFHLMNTYRRAGMAFVDRESYVDTSGVRQPDHANDVVAPIPVVPVNGLSDVNSTLLTAIQAYWTGNGVYTPTNTASTTLANEANARSTRYIVTVVGAGASSPIALRPEEVNAQRAAVLQQLVQDVLVPLVCTILLPLGEEAVDNSLNYNGGYNAVQDLVGTLATSAPQIYDLMNAGQVGDALALAWTTVAGSNVLQAYLFQFIQDQFGKFVSGAAMDQFYEAGSEMLTKLDILSGAMVAFDLATVAANIASSNGVDQFIIDVSADKVVLSPSSATVQNGGTQSFTVTVPAASGSGQTVVYHWSNSASYGHLSDGQSGHLDSFDSSKNTATYTANATGTGNDTITATAYLVQGQNRTQIGDPQTATVTVQQVRSTTVSVSLRQNNTGWGGSVHLAGSFTPAVTQGVTYHWYVQRDFLAGGGNAFGSISDGSHTGQDFTTTSSSVTYTAPAQGSVPASAGIDDVYVEVRINGVSTGSGYAQVAFGCDSFGDPNDPNNPNGQPQICLP